MKKITILESHYLEVAHGIELKISGIKKINPAEYGMVDIFGERKVKIDVYINHWAARIKDMHTLNECDHEKYNY